MAVRFIATLVLCLAWAGSALAQSSILVRTPTELQRAIRDAGAGDTIRLADGVWHDIQILFTGEGTPAQPITLTAETPGAVILSGQSNLRMAGAHLIVSNLVFKDGYSPTGEVVSFRQNSERRARDSRVTGLVIDGYSKPDRLEVDNWVAIYGRGNRVDHSHLANKTNAGTTLVVVRDPVQGLENDARIDHNYFGPRPVLGANGGETLRIGTSSDSRSNSRSVIEFNWFDRCDGEVEIISNKSGGNIYRGNVFFESRGTLTLRHGHGNLVEDNVFLGNGLDHTGGIRVINRDQTVRNNYLEGLDGEDFFSALSVLYGVPDGPINRYDPVANAVIANNTIIEAESVFLGAGADDERSAAPTDSRFVANLIVNATDSDLLHLGPDITGITISGNIQSPALAPGTPGGFEARTIGMSRNAHGLLVPEGLDGVGARRDLRPVSREETGVSWYSKDDRAATLDSGRVVQVQPGEGTLAAAVAAAGAGDRLNLAAGHYSVDRVLVLNRPLTVSGPSGGEARITFDRPTLFEIGRGAHLKLTHLTISGRDAPDSVGNAVIRTRAGAANYILIIEDSRVEDLTVNRDFDVFRAEKGTMADLLSLERVSVRSVSGMVIGADSETDDHGTYNAERVSVTDSTFRDISGPVVDLYRGGTDESTTGPNLVIADSTFERVGRAGSRPFSINLHGVQTASIVGNRFIDSGGVRFHRTVGTPTLTMAGNETVGTPELDTNLATVEAGL